MLRKWICVLMALCMIFGMLSIGAAATETGGGIGGGGASTETSEPSTEAATEPSTEAATEPSTEAATEPSTEAATEPSTEAATEPSTEAATEPSTEATTEPATEEPTEEPDPSGSCGDNLTWKLERATGLLTISGKGPMDDLKAYPWSEFADQIKSLEVDDRVNRLGEGAFSGLTKLKTVKLPAGTSVIPYNAFYNCTSLTSIGFPSGVLAIERRAFANCTALTKLRFYGKGPNIDDQAFKGVTATAVFPGTDTSWALVRQNYGGKITWEPDTPKDTSGLFGDNFSWILEDGKLTITGWGHMRGWDTEQQVPWHKHRSKVTSVVMVGKIWSIYPWAFKDMTNLKSVTWPEDINTL